MSLLNRWLSHSFLRRYSTRSSRAYLLVSPRCLARSDAYGFKLPEIFLFIYVHSGMPLFVAV
jgi:hypothetical protein